MAGLQVSSNGWLHLVEGIKVVDFQQIFSQSVRLKRGKKEEKEK
jgi:hypothetical protein